jgi:hypothetical protein
VRQALPVWLLLLVACSTEEWRNADLQLDVRGAEIHDEDLVRICVEGVGILEQAAGAGRLGFTGIPQGDDLVVTIDVIDQIDSGGVGTWRARAGPVSIGPDAVLVEADVAECEDDCGLCMTAGEKAREGDPDWLLAVQFVD